MKTLSYSFTVLEMNESKSLLTGLVDVGRASTLQDARDLAWKENPDLYARYRLVMED